MKIRVLMFGIARDICGAGSVEIGFDAGPVTTRDLLETLKEKYPALTKLKALTIAVNTEYATTDQMISYTDEVALIPPVSGG